jgi:hypothetical protein
MGKSGAIGRRCGCVRTKCASTILLMSDDLAVYGHKERITGIWVMGTTTWMLIND